MVESIRIEILIASIGLCLALSKVIFDAIKDVSKEVKELGTGLDLCNKDISINKARLDLIEAEQGHKEEVFKLTVNGLVERTSHNRAALEAKLNDLRTDLNKKQDKP
jgi:uncharacterized protein YoxC